MIHDWLITESLNLPNDVANELRQTLLVGVDVDAVVLQGDVSELILKTAEKRRVNLIVLTSHARGAISRVTFGSVSEKLVRSAPVPACLVRSQPRTSTTSGQEFSANLARTA